jgi:hypothetical protein
MFSRRINNPTTILIFYKYILAGADVYNEKTTNMQQIILYAHVIIVIILYNITYSHLINIYDYAYCAQIK